MDTGDTDRSSGDGSAYSHHTLVWTTVWCLERTTVGKPLSDALHSSARASRLLCTFTSSLAHANGRATGLLLRTAALSYRCRRPTLGSGSLHGPLGLCPAFITLDDV